MTRHDQGPTARHDHHHTLADQRPGGAPLALTAGPDAWIAFVELHAARERVEAAVSAIETMIESFARKHPVGGAVVLQRHDAPRVVVLIRIGGHEVYRHLAAAWDAFKLDLEGRKAAERLTLALWRVVRADEKFVLDPAAGENFVLGPNVAGTPSVTFENDDRTQNVTLALDTQHSAQRLHIVKTL
jgi:hypothetical protein